MNRSTQRMLNPASHKADGRRGDAALIGALLYMILVAAVLVSMTSQAAVAQRTTQNSRDYLLANQMANVALANAVFEVNQSDFEESKFPKIPGTYNPANPGLNVGSSNAKSAIDAQCGIPMATAIKTESAAGWKKGSIGSLNGGCGEQAKQTVVVSTGKKGLTNLEKTAKWQWYVERTSADNDSSNLAARYKIYAVGGYNKTIRTITSDLYSMKVRGADNNAATGTIVYDTAPSAVFSHALFSNTSTSISDSTITGALGSNGVITAPDPVRASVFGGSVSPTFLYDYANITTEDPGNTRCVIEGKSLTAFNAGGTNHLCYNKVRVASQLKMNVDVINNAANTCTNAGEARDWKASDYANPQFYATGDLACYRNVTFDKATTVVGTGTFSIVATGKIAISASISAPSKGSLVLYHALPRNPGVTANISFVDSTPTTRTNLDLYIYSPDGNCSFTGAAITGGVACDKITLVDSSATWKKIDSAVDRPGFTPTDASLFNRTIWYLNDFDEKAAVDTKK